MIDNKDLSAIFSNECYFAWYVNYQYLNYQYLNNQYLDNSLLSTWFDINVWCRDIPNIELTIFDKFDLLANHRIVRHLLC